MYNVASQKQKQKTRKYLRRSYIKVAGNKNTMKTIKVSKNGTTIKATEKPRGKKDKTPKNADQLKPSAFSV